ncbi:MAG: hypothetical protein AB7I27_00500 [Bacteriovoracaceae bacterium]
MALNILRLALKFGDMPEITSGERDFSKDTVVTRLKEETKKEFCDLVKSANCICIDSDHLLRVAENSLATNPLTEQVSIVDEKLSEIPVCPPFSCQWIELSYSLNSSMAPSIKLNDYVITILGMLVHETSPNVFNIYTLENHRGLDRGSVNKFSASKNVSGSNSGESNLQMFFAVWMKAINNGSLCVEDGEEVVMLPKDNAKKENKKRPHQIRRIVRIVPRNSKQEVKPIMNKGKIDFSHRWEVRGHWRKVAGIGKDREGKYGVNGITWVKECVKGPEHRPIIKKIRWVQGQKNLPEKTPLNFSNY